jgi:hypothetical protein
MEAPDIAPDSPSPIPLIGDTVPGGHSIYKRTIAGYFGTVAFIGHNGYCFLAENKRRGKARPEGGRRRRRRRRDGAERDDGRIKRVVFAVCRDATPTTVIISR